MGLSAYQSPSDAGVLCVILVNTAISISIMKERVRSILHVIGIHMASGEDYSGQTLSVECRGTPSETYMEEFRSRAPSILYHSLTKQECSVCLVDFKLDTEINRLSCGHVFHKSCVEKWLRLWNVTCPLCRNHMMIPIEAEGNTSTPSWFTVSASGSLAASAPGVDVEPMRIVQNCFRKQTKKAGIVGNLTEKSLLLKDLACSAFRNAGDDCVSIVNGSRNIVVRKLTCGPGRGISIESLGKNNSEDQVSNILVDKAIISNTTNGVRIKSWQALRYIRQIAQESSGEVVYGLGRQPAVLRTLSQRLSRGFNDAINGFNDDGWSLMNCDSAEDVIISINSTKNLRSSANSSTSLWFPGGVLCVKASMLFQMLEVIRLECHTAGLEDFRVERYPSLTGAYSASFRFI